MSRVRECAWRHGKSRCIHVAQEGSDFCPQHQHLEGTKRALRLRRKTRSTVSKKLLRATIADLRTKLRKEKDRERKTKNLLIVHLRANGITYAAIGRILGVSRQAVHERYSRIKQECPF